MNSSVRLLACVASSRSVFFKSAQASVVVVAGINSVNRVCGIHHYVRPTLFSFRARRRKELLKHPEREKPSPRSSFVDWNYTAELYAFGKRMNEEFDEKLLREAFVDNSYVHQERARMEELGIEGDLEALKDNVELKSRGRDLITSTLIRWMKKEFPKLPAEGLESVVFKLTSSDNLGHISSNLGTKDLIQCNVYPPTNEILASAFEAVVGALEKSSGLERAQKFTVDFVASQLCGKDISDFWEIPRPWHMLLDMYRQSGGGPLEPRILREAGKHTLLSAYVVGIYNVDKQLVGTGIGETIDIAQEMAARDVLSRIFGTRGPIAPFEFQSANHPVTLIPHVRNP